MLPGINHQGSRCPQRIGMAGAIAADAVCAAIQRVTPGLRTFHRRFQTRQRFIDHETPSTLPFASDSYMRAMNAALMVDSAPAFGFRARRPRPVPDAPRDSDCLEISQKRRQHGGGSRLRIVKKNDPLADDSEPIGDQLQFLLRVIGFSRWPKGRHRTRRYARLQQVERRRCTLKAGKAEERGARNCGRDPVQRGSSAAMPRSISAMASSA